MIITDPSVRSLAKIVLNVVVIVCQEPEGLEGITVVLIVETANTGAVDIADKVGELDESPIDGTTEKVY